MHADDMDLVREFAANGSEAAFATLVRRHVNLVYSAALRRLGNAAEAEEVAQIVFLILAKKARRLRRGTILSGWLYQTAQLTAANHQRAAIRRQHREQEAFMQFSEQSEPDVSWHRLSPLLEEAMARLGQKERDAIVLRFFDNRTVREVAAALGLREDAAQKRVNRATDKLRDYFVRRGIQVSSAALLASIGTHAVQAAPVELASKIAAGGALKGALGGASTLTLKTTLNIMAWTKAKTAIVAGVCLLLVTGTATITVKEVAHHREQSVWNHIAGNDFFEQLDNAPPAVSIRPTRFARDVAIAGNGTAGKIIGVHQPFESLLARAYNVSPCRILSLTPLPQGDFDFIASTPRLQREALQKLIKQRFGIVCRPEMRETDVLLLTVKRPGAPGLKPTASRGWNSSSSEEVGRLRRVNGPIGFLAWDFEQYLHIPVVDRTGLVGRFDVDLAWDDEKKWDDSGRYYFTNPESLKQAVLDQLGLELVPSREPTEMMVAEKAN